MTVDYKQQYRPDQLEPFFPHEIIKMSVVVFCTLAVIMLLAVLPVLGDLLGIKGLEHVQEPANPRGATPVGIKPEWYFLGTYQYLRLMPTQFLGISGKTWGVLSQGPLMMVVVLLPFWYRKRADQRPGWFYRLGVTAAGLGFLGLTIWGGWPERVVNGHEELIPLGQYMHEHPMIFIMPSLALAVFYALIWQEVRAIRHILDGPAKGGAVQAADRESKP
jgi:quinol-cytochrome oxidoreductase complex cytochrome b subunit